MKLANIKSGGSECVAVIIPRGFVRIDVLNVEKRSEWPTDIKRLTSGVEAEAFKRWYRAGGRVILENISRKFVVPASKAEIIGEVYETED